MGVSILPQKYFAERIGGEWAEVSAAIPPGASPANYQPTPKEIGALEVTDLFFGLGVPAENLYRPILDSESGPPLWVDQQEKVASIVGLLHLDEEEKAAEGHAHGAADPHIWLSPRRAKVMAEEMAEVMGAALPAQRAYFRKNLEGLLEEIEETDVYISDRLSPYKGRPFILYHPSYGYFAQDYGLELWAVESEGKDATARRLKELVDKAKAARVRDVFYQAESDSAQSRALAEELGGKTVRLEPLAYGYPEGLKRAADLLAETFEAEQ